MITNIISEDSIGLDWDFEHYSYRIVYYLIVWGIDSMGCTSVKTQLVWLVSNQVLMLQQMN